MITLPQQNAFRREIERIIQPLSRPCTQNEFAKLTMDLEDVIGHMLETLPECFNREVQS